MMEITEQQKHMLKGMICPYCKKPSKFLKTSESIYGKDYGPVYVCRGNCKAWVGCHPGTNKPLGRLANKRLRDLKMQVHDSFDKIWHYKIMRRQQAYKWLSELLGIPKRYTHIGMFGEETCIKAIRECKKLLKETYK